MRLDLSARGLLGGMAFVAFGVVGVALVTQYRFGMQPCPWCTLQRFIFLVMGVVAAAGAVIGTGLWRRVLAAVLLLLALAGAAAALWQQFVAAASDSCNLTLADKIMQSLGLYDIAPSIFVPWASCADAAVNLLGVPYAFWSLATFAACGLVSLVILRTRA